MKEKEISYISFEDFVKISGVKESTIIKNYKNIPGITKTEHGFTVVSGTRYPGKIGLYKLNDSSKKRFVLLKMISQYKYINHIDLKIEHEQFKDMLRELLSAELIKPNNLCNNYGANGYDCTMRGDELIKKSDKLAIKELMIIISNIANIVGTYTGAILSEIYYKY